MLQNVNETQLAFKKSALANDQLFCFVYQPICIYQIRHMMLLSVPDLGRSFFIVREGIKMRQTKDDRKVQTGDFDDQNNLTLLSHDHHQSILH